MGELVANSTTVNASTLVKNDTFIDGGRVLKVKEVTDTGMVISEVIGLATDAEIAAGAKGLVNDLSPIGGESESQSAPRRKARGSRK